MTGEAREALNETKTSRENNVFISLRGIEKSYGDKIILNGLSLDIRRGETLCVLGESGGGKTTLLNILARLTACDKGEAVYAPPEAQSQTDGGEKRHKKKRDKANFPRVSYAFQDGRLLPNLTALENLTFAGGEKAYCRALLNAAELSDKENKRPSALSGGEKQRVSLMRAFAPPFDLLLADEPFSALDIALKERMISLFRTLLYEKSQNGDKKKAIVVTHSVKEAMALGDRVAVLKKGRIAAEFRIGESESENERLRAALLSLLMPEE